MKNMFKQLFRRYRHIFFYLLLGMLTTAVNFAVYYLLLNFCRLSAGVSNGTAWFVSVLVAFFTNKPLAFYSNNWSIKVVLPEFLKFTGCRFISGAIETMFLVGTVDILDLNGNIMKLLISIFVVVTNYLFGKYLVFRKK